MGQRDQAIMQTFVLYQREECLQQPIQPLRLDHQLNQEDKPLQHLSQQAEHQHPLAPAELALNLQ